MSNLDSAALNAAVATIREGGEIVPGGLLALLYVDSKADRYRINCELARAYLDSERLEQAADFADRAWLLADDSLDFLPAYVEINWMRGDLERIREAYKKTGLRYAAANCLTDALRYFNLCHYVYQSAGKGDQYEYDFDILNAVEHLAAPYRAQIESLPAASLGSKIRVAYLVFGATHSQSVLIKLLCYFARHHDPDHFAVRFFVPENPTTHSHALSYLQTNLQKLSAAGAQVEMPQAEDESGNLLEIAKMMANFKPDILITTAALAEYAHFFLACTRPAPVRIGLVYGPPEQYAPPGFDRVIAATRHPLIDSPCDGTLVPVEVDLPDPASIAAHPRSEFDIPAAAILIVIVGRPEKFIHGEYWQVLSDILGSNQNAWMLIVGIVKIPDACVQYVAPSVLPRFKFTGYRNEYLRILSMADIVLDTFPSGGGIVLLDTMALGIPLVTFRNDYSRKFNQTHWSPGEELFDVDELIVPCGDYGRFKALVGKLVADPVMRREMGVRCKESVHRLNGQPGRMVQRCEAVYRDVLQKRQDLLSASSLPIINIAKLSSPRAAIRPRWRRALSRARRVISGLLDRI